MKKTKMLSGLLAVVLVFGLALAGCGSKVQGEPGDAVLGCMESFKAMDFDAMANYVSKTEEIQTLKDEFSSEDLDIVKMVLKRATFEAVSYTHLLSLRHVPGGELLRLVLHRVL